MVVDANKYWVINQNNVILRNLKDKFDEKVRGFDTMIITIHYLQKG